MMDKETAFRFVSVLGLATLLGCAAPAPTATPTQPPVAAPTPTKAAPTPTKAPTATPTKRPLVKAIAAVSSQNTSQAAWVVAKSKNYFNEEGLDIEWNITGSGAKALTAVVGQSAHITTAASPEVISAISKGQPIQVAGSVAVGEPVSLVMRKDVADRKGISAKSSLAERVNALKGLRIASSSPGSGSDGALRYVLQKFNLDPDRDVEVSYVGLPAIIPSFEAGAVDAFSSGDPDSSRAVVGGLGIAAAVLGIDFPETRQNIYATITTHKQVIASQPEIPEAFVRAIWQALRLMKENRSDAEETYRKEAFPDLELPIFKAAFETAYSFHFPESPAVTAQMFKAALDYRNGTTKESPLDVKYEDFYTPKFVEAAKKQLGY